jgi:MFS family permease
MKLPGAGLPALRARNFRLYLTGQLISLCGTAAQQVALSWLVYELTHSSELVGLTVLLLQLPIVALAPLGGALADRFDRRSVLLATQIAGLLQALALGVLALGNAATIQVVLGLSLLLGLINCVDVPARQSIVARLVDRPADIRNAVAINAASLHLSRLLGASLAAVVLARFGVPVCFLLNAGSYLAAIAVLLRLPRTPSGSISALSASSLREGLRFCSEQPAIRRLFVLLIVLSLLVVPYPSLLPAATTQWALGHASSYARLMTISGAGALAAAVLIALFHEVTLLLRVIPAAALLSGAVLVAVGLSSAAFLGWGLPLAVALLGFCITVVVSGSNVLFQYQVPESLRGRVMGLFVMAFNGIAALGALLCGALADRVGLASTFTTAGLCGLVAGAWAAATLARGAAPETLAPRAPRS